MSDLQGRKVSIAHNYKPDGTETDCAGQVFKTFNQEFVVDERYNVTKELGQGAYGIVWYVRHTEIIHEEAP